MVNVGGFHPVISLSACLWLELKRLGKFAQYVNRQRIKAGIHCLMGVLSFSEHRAPTFTIEPPNKVIFLNSSGESVHCAALGNPRPSITWVLADGTAVQDLPGLRLALANGTLLFLPFMAENYRQDIHASTYRCVASNLVGKISSRDIRIRAGECTC
ncbi:down syndrome cell adhesion molecule-like protein Dscam2 [Trichonephila inaurata madagascariensis]|uniref:Down syndrome cell adhesion molecule-like protein Dscam2 n=1 Tax=Trichonephila inaurata madagascariensis TaxID=2747483 RepID=A0A8X6YS25_9ARAC|nr:down syndrome cell adhesion molecule-like protein Dscam2 [Trichonephila inaurata madagascariensis]